jgi:transposase
LGKHGRMRADGRSSSAGGCMEVVERAAGDIGRLRELVGRERKAVQRDRLRAVLLALQGEEKVAIAATLGRGKSFVEDWVYAYRDAPQSDNAISAIAAKKQSGRRPLLHAKHRAAFQARIEGGALQRDGVCVLRGEDLRRILRDEFGAHYAPKSVYALLAREGFSSVKPRPVHEKHDAKAATDFKESAPLLCKK